MREEYCKRCGRQVRMMCQQMTGYCSAFCEEATEEVVEDGE